jgi:hypothetical protein
MTEQAAEVKLNTIPVQRATTFGTATSSPVKDNDMLSDEILKSLSPVAGSAQGFNQAVANTASQHSNHNAARDSSYTLQDYDSYWEDTEDKAKAPPETSAPIATIPEVPDAQTELSNSTTGPVDNPIESLVSPQSSSLRRRFSWEAEETPTPQSTTNTNSGASTQGLGVNEAAVTPTEGSRQPTDASANVVDTSNGGGHSPINSHPPVLESPSLPSLAGASSDAGARAVDGLVEDKIFDRPASSLVSPVVAADDSALIVQTSPSATPSPVAPAFQQGQPELMTFRDIMSLNNPSERIVKYNETRDIFLSTDSGLDQWLVHLKAQHPDMSPSGPLFGAQTPHQPPQGSTSNTAGAVPGAQAAPAQQPYYQQYLNASSPTASGSPTTRTRLAGLPIPSQVSGSTFGHSSNQIGTKSKELMHSAGKMGKGLLSKGRSKLRGTGEKVFH